MNGSSQSRWKSPVFPISSSSCNSTFAPQEPRVKRQRQSNGSSQDNLVVEDEFSSNSKLDREQEIESLPWVTKFSPATVDKIAMHPKKIADVKMWLSAALDVSCSEDQRKKIAVFCGPAGCGKSTIIRLLSNDRRLKIREFNFTDGGLLPEDENDRIFNMSQVQQFQSFLMLSKAAENASTCSSDNEDDSNEIKDLILIEEIPVGFYRQPDRYHDVLKNYIGSNSPKLIPIVFILTSNCSQEIPLSFTLFPVDVVSRLNIEIISFRPIATTYLKRAMEEVDYFHNLTEAEQTGYLESCSGDIRNLLNSLELRFKHEQCIRVSYPKHKNKRAKVSQILKPIGNKKTGGIRDCALEIFHLMGKILHVKRRYVDNVTYDGDFHIYPLHENVSNLLDSKIISSKRINLTIQQNYCKNIETIHNAAVISDTLSFSDLFPDFHLDGRFDLSEYSSELATRTAMYNLTPSIVDESGDKINDPKRKKAETIPFVPTFQSSKKELMLQDRLQFYEKVKCKRDIESSCRNMISSRLPVHSVKELFLDIFPFVTSIYKQSNHDDQVRNMQIFYYSIDNLLNDPENDTRITSYGSQQREEELKWIPESSKKLLKEIRFSDLEIPLKKDKKIFLGEEYEARDRIDHVDFEL